MGIVTMIVVGIVGLIYGSIASYFMSCGSWIGHFGIVVLAYCIVVLGEFILGTDRHTGFVAQMIRCLSHALVWSVLVDEIMNSCGNGWFVDFWYATIALAVVNLTVSAWNWVRS